MKIKFIRENVEAMWMAMRFLVLVTLTFAISSCKKPIQNPENTDLIYQDLQNELKSVMALLAAQEKDVASKKSAAEKAPIRTGERELARESYFHSKKKLSKLQEQLRYWEIQVQQRKTEARKKYAVAFEQDLEWPDKQEYEAYKIDKALKGVPREWSPERRIRAMKKAAAQKPPPPSSH